MPPFNGKCEIPEQQMGRGVIVIGEKRSGHDEQNKAALQGGTPKKEMRPQDLEIQMITQDEEDVKVASNPKSYNTLPLLKIKAMEINSCSHSVLIMYRVCQRLSTSERNLQVAPHQSPRTTAMVGPSYQQRFPNFCQLFVLHELKKNPFSDDLEGMSSQTEDDAPLLKLKRLRRGPAKTSKC
jgi:hypothetical protein